MCNEFCGTITVMIILVLVVFGLVFGSFVNALVWRFHEVEEVSSQFSVLSKRKSQNKKKLSELRTKNSELSMVHGRSRCSNCGHELAAKDLVPVVSWVWLRGKCRYCGVKIQDNPLVEVSTGLLFVLSYLWWPLPLHGVGLFQFIVWLLFVVAFVALATYDLKWFLLPDRIVFPIIAVAAAEVIAVAVWKHDAWFALDAALGALTISGIFYVLFQLSGGAWIGGGDVKLAIVLGLLAGSPVQALLILFFASVIGTVCSIPMLLKGKKGLKMHVPFGPFLLAGTFLVVLFGQQIIIWYTNLVPYH
jgi:prepilin signal peptidase PulO-like enzyme (type II secretory pathway)